MATITPVQGSPAGAAVAYVAATSGGDTIAAGVARTVVFKVNNAAGSSITVTLAGAVPCSFGALHNIPIVCPANTITEIEIPAQCYTTAGNIGVTYSAVTTVTVAATTT